MTSRSSLRARGVVLAVVTVMLPASTDGGAGQNTAAPGLREARLPAQTPEALGDGEVVLELTIDSHGAVTHIEPIRVTPPYADLVAHSAAAWRFGAPQTRDVPDRLFVYALIGFRAPLAPITPQRK